MKLKSLFFVFLLFMGSLFITAPAAQASSAVAAKAAVPVIYDQIVGYRHHQNLPGHNRDDEIFRNAALRCTTTGSKYHLNWLTAPQLSSLLLWVPSGRTFCNWMEVTNTSGNTWGTCLNKNKIGFNFGPDFNDSTVSVKVIHKLSCPKWHIG